MAGNNVRAREQESAFGKERARVSKNVQGFQTAKNASKLDFSC